MEDHTERKERRIWITRRFVMSEEDQALLMQNSSMVHGRRFYRAKVRDALMEKYAAMTNPQGKEPGTKENPLIRFGREYVYNEKGNLVPFVRQESVVLTPDMKPTKEQADIIAENQDGKGVPTKRA